MARPDDSVAVTLDRQRRLKATFEALCEIEEALDLDAWGGGIQKAMLKARTHKVVLAALLRHEDASVTTEQAAELLQAASLRGQYGEVAVKMMTAIGQAFSAPEGESAQEGEAKESPLSATGSGGTGTGLQVVSN